MKTHVAALSALMSGGKVALIRFKRNEYAGMWGFLGGKPEPGEYVADAVVREVGEELGAECRFERIQAVVDVLIGPANDQFRLFMYMCELTPPASLEVKPLDIPEGEIGWFDLAGVEAIRSEMVPADYEILQSVAFGRKEGYFTCHISEPGPAGEVLHFAHLDTAVRA